MLAFEIFKLQSNRTGCADLGTGDRVVVKNLQKKDRFLAVPQRQSTEIPFVLVAQDQPLRFVFLQADLLFPIADFGHQCDFSEAEVVTRAVFEGEDFIAVDFQVFRGTEEIDGGKTVRLYFELVSDRRVAKAMDVFHVDSVRLRLKEHEICLQLAPVNFQREFFAVIHDNFRLDHVLGRHRIEAQR